MEVYERIKMLRLKSNLSMKACAEKSGIPYNTYHKYEYGEREIGIQALQKLADLYNVSTDYILGRETSEGQGEPDTLDLITNKLHLNMYERAIVAAYLALDTETRTKLAQTVKKMADKMDGQEENVQEEMRTVKFVANNGNNREISITKSQESKIADLLDEIERNNNGNIW